MPQGLHPTQSPRLCWQARAKLRGMLLVKKLQQGKRPTGYVAPWWEMSAATPHLLMERGIKYDHSQMHNDFTPYWMRIDESWTST